MTVGTDWGRSRRVTAEEAMAAVRSGDRVFVHGACATPTSLVTALVNRASSLEDVEVIHMHTAGPAPYTRPDLAGHFRHRALFIGDNVREAVNAGRADFVPVFLSDIPSLFRHGPLPLDVALVQVSPPDAHGYCSLGTSVDCAKAAIETARLVIAEVNQRMPRTLGDSFVQLRDLDWLVEVDRPLYEQEREALTPELRQLGANVAELVPDGATLQLGIGAVPDAVAASLTEKHDLGVHTEMFSDGVLDLVRLGVITGSAKTLHQGKIVASFLIGSQALYDFVDDNPMIEMHPVDYVNDTTIIRRNAAMTAINSAMQVDLTGQVCADSLGHRFYSGVGGQIDFIRGAALAQNGRPIIALTSTARGGTVSRIVPELLAGAGVTTTRAHVHYVATEYGVAALHGRSIRERTRALIAIAHPAFRDELTAAARRHLSL